MSGIRSDSQLDIQFISQVLDRADTGFCVDQSFFYRSEEANGLCQKP